MAHLFAALGLDCAVELRDEGGHGDCDGVFACGLLDEADGMAGSKRECRGRVRLAISLRDVNI